MWDQLQKSDLPPPEEDMVKWEAEFHQMMNGPRNMGLDFDTMGPLDDPSPSFQSVPFDDGGIPLLGDYEFRESPPPLIN